jgi:drug/metabolite transporter (DMT)-like permease
VDLSAAAVMVFWAPLLLLIAAVFLYGIRRDQDRPAGVVVAVAGLCVLVLTVTTGLVGWGAYQQQRAEQDACTPSSEC